MTLGMICRNNVNIPLKWLAMLNYESTYNGANGCFDIDRTHKTKYVCCQAQSSKFVERSSVWRLSTRIHLSHLYTFPCSPNINEYNV